MTAPDHVFVWNGVALAPGTNHASAQARFGSTIVSDVVDWELR